MSEPISPATETINAASRETAPPSRLQQFLLPSLEDWMFIAIFVWLFFLAFGAPSMLADGDAGWHIRTGEHILAGGGFPREDLFSFSMEGRQWFAWEWLSDVILAVVHGWDGLQGVVVLAGIVIAATAALHLRFMIWAGANTLVAILAVICTAASSMIHWLARPHMFTWGLLIGTIWLLEADRKQHSKRVYWLIPLVAIWVNIHGGFMVALICVGIYAVGLGLEQLWAAYKDNEAEFKFFVPNGTKRYTLLFVGCALATLINPYTYELHQHIFGYLGSDFILNNVQEFQSPDFRGESMLMFEGALLLGLVLAGRMAWRGEITRGLLVLAWAHAALTSVRHVPLFMLVATVFLAIEISQWLNEGARAGNPWLMGLKELADDYSGKSPDGVKPRPFLLNWAPLAAVFVVVWFLNSKPDQDRWKAEFPALRFPAVAVEKHGDMLRGQNVLTTDQWGDYLIYHQYPDTKVFIDGRSDFYDPKIREDYVHLMGSRWDWPEIMERYKFDLALLPVTWSLTSVLKESPEWSVVYDDGFAILFEPSRESAGLEAQPQTD